MSEVADELVHNTAFWAAVVILLETLQEWLFPGIPLGVVQAVKVVLVIVFSAVSGKVVVAQVRAIRARQAAMKEILSHGDLRHG